MRICGKSKRWKGGKKLISGMLGLCVALTIFGGIPAAATEQMESAPQQNTAAPAAEESDLFLSYPSEAMFDSLWVGDTVVFASHRYNIESGAPYPGSLYPGNEIEVLSGTGVEIVEGVEVGAAEPFMGIKFTEPGTAEIKVAVADLNTGESGERNFTFTVSERPADKPVKVIANAPAVTSQKVGEIVNLTNAKGVRFENLNYGEVPANARSLSGGLDIDMGSVSLLKTGGSGGADYPLVGDDRSYGDSPFAGLVYEDLRGFWTDGQTPVQTADNPLGVYYHAGSPGTITVQPVYASEKIGGPICTITVEEPVITANAPASVKAGTSIQLNTELTNTALENLKVQDFENGVYYYDGSYGSDERCLMAYKPSVTVIEGQDCVKQSGQDYSNTLSSSETLTFQKAGTVKLKVTYRQILYSDYFDGIIFTGERYHPEKTFTIQVTDDSVPEPPADSSETPPADGGEEQTITVADGQTGVKLTAQEGILPEDVVLVVQSSDYVLPDAAGKFAAFDLSLEKDGVKIQPNGKVQVSIPIPEGYDKTRLAVYYIGENGEKTELPSVVKDDAILFETDHFSLYVVAEKEAAVPPKTGDGSGNYILLAMILAVGSGIAMRRLQTRKRFAEGK